MSLELDENETAGKKTTEEKTPVKAPVKASALPQSTSARDRAYVEALDARIELAEGFIKYNAFTEANEIFDEVMKTGTPEQKERVKAIRSRLKEDGVK
ncbi:hypothetical protein EVA_06961 [gut metagenome]|uniref:Uncharacterized protein n=1 Tax=gut metagenome TaxID=749906 RepID=J9GDH5_9ZZZZ